MQVLFKNNFVQLVAESKAESYRLLDFVYQKAKDEPKKKEEKRSYKKHNPVIACKFCGKGYKSRKGMGVHLRKCAKKTFVTSTNPDNVHFVSGSSSTV